MGNQIIEIPQKMKNQVPMKGRSPRKKKYEMNGSQDQF